MNYSKFFGKFFMIVVLAAATVFFLLSGLSISFNAVYEALPKDQPANTSVPVDFHSTIIELYGVGPLNVSVQSANPVRLEYVGSDEPAPEDIEMEFAQTVGAYVINAPVPVGSWVLTSPFSGDEEVYITVEAAWTTRLELGRALLNVFFGFILLFAGALLFIKGARL